MLGSRLFFVCLELLLVCVSVSVLLVSDIEGSLLSSEDLLSEHGQLRSSLVLILSEDMTPVICTLPHILSGLQLARPSQHAYTARSEAQILTPDLTHETSILLPAINHWHHNTSKSPLHQHIASTSENPHRRVFIWWLGSALEKR